MRAVKKIKGFMFNIHEAVWWIVAEIEDWLYPYNDRLTPSEKFEVRVKNPYTEEEYMVEEWIQGLNDKVNRLQDEVMDLSYKVSKHEQQLQFKVKPKKSSPSVSGKINVSQ
tara:strand:- start:194 stop:526 length:333 start_codon:yes stop_codon:yes gene_type:complete